MSLDIGTAVREGASRLTARNALLLLGGFFLVGVLSPVAQQSLCVEAFEALARAAEESAGAGGEGAFTQEQAAQLREQARTQRQQSPLAVNMPAAAAGLLAFALAFVAEALHVVAVRVFVSDATDRIPGEFLRRNMPLAVLNGFVGGIVVAVLVGIGLVFLVVPGIFLYISFLFLRQEIAVEDRNFVDALANSWSLAKGDRFELFGLVVVLFGVALLAVVPSTLTAVVGVDPLVTAVIGLVLAPVVGVFGVAVTSRAYAQLREEREPADEPEDDEDDEPVGALGPDDLPEP